MTRTVERFPVGRARGARRRPAAATVSDATVSATTPRRTRPGASRDDNDNNSSSTALTTSTVGARLTAKQRLVSTLYNLDMDVTALRQQINELTLHRSLLHTRALYSQRDLDGSAVKKAKGYFHAFRRGYRDPDVAAAAYLASVADEDLQLGVTDLGRDMLLEQWRRYTAYFAIRKYDIRTVRVIASETESNACIVRGEGVFHGTFTRQALEIAFPTVLQDPWLTQELLGRALVTPVAFVLHFDDHGRFVRHDGEVDLFAALAETLGDPVRAAAIMERAHVAEEGMLDAPDDKAPVVEPVARVARVKRSRAVPADAYQYDDDDDERGEYAPGSPRFAREPDYEPDDRHEEDRDVYFVEL